MPTNLFDVPACSKNVRNGQPIRFPGSITERWPPIIGRYRWNTGKPSANRRTEIIDPARRSDLISKKRPRRQPGPFADGRPVSQGARNRTSFRCGKARKTSRGMAANGQTIYFIRSTALCRNRSEQPDTWPTITGISLTHFFSATTTVATFISRVGRHRKFHM